MNADSGALARLVDGIASQGWASCDAFIDAALARSLHDHAAELYERSQFKSAAVGAGERRAVRPDVRSDEICWLVDCCSPPLRQVCTRFEELRLALNRALALGLFEHELHYARYGPGAHYQRHIDHSSSDARRIISTALYLNEHWTPQHGGQLRLHLDEEAPHAIDILPEAGRLVIFLSQQFYHEVLPVERERVSLTGWFRRRGRTL